MRHSCSIRMIAVFMMANMAGLGFVPSAQGAVVGTETALASQQRAERIERLNSVLARDDVRAELERLGVAPADAQARVAALSDSELLALDQRDGIAALMGDAKGRQQFFMFDEEVRMSLQVRGNRCRLQALGR